MCQCGPLLCYVFGSVPKNSGEGLGMRIVRDDNEFRNFYN